MQGLTTESFRKKLIWVMLFRIVIISILLIATLMRGIREFDSIIRLNSSFFILVIIASYLASLVYLYLMRKTRWYRFSAISQVVGDILFSSALCYFSGKDSSIFTIFFAVTIIISSILFFRTGAYISAAISSVIILIFSLDRQFLFLPYIPGMIVDTSKPTIDQAIYSLFIHVFAYLVIAQLSSYLSGELKTTSEKYLDQKRDYNILFEQYRAIVENLSDGVLLFRDRSLIFLNDVASKIFSIDTESIRDLRDEDMEALLSRLLSTSGEELTMPEGKNKGQVLSVRHRRKIHEDGVTDDIFVVSDLTESRKLQEEIIRSERLASIGKVSTGFAHEIRNPLSSILGSIDLIKKTSTLNRENSMLLDIVVKELLRVNELIERFLMFAKPIPPKFTKTDISRLISEVVDLIRFDKDYRENIEIEIIDRLKEEIDVDPALMRQVFWNMIKNSLQAIKREGKILLSLSKVPDKGTAMITISDTGTGISATEISKIFDPFYSTKEKSTGIGLSIIHSIIREHNGSISVESTLDEGTIFTILLPLRQTGE